MNRIVTSPGSPAPVERGRPLTEALRPRARQLVGGEAAAGADYMAAAPAQQIVLAVRPVADGLNPGTGIITADDYD